MAWIDSMEHMKARYEGKTIERIEVENPALATIWFTDGTGIRIGACVRNTPKCEKCHHTHTQMVLLITDPKKD